MNNMWNKTRFASAALALLAVLSFNAATQERVQSLRGPHAVDGQSLEVNVNRWQRDRDPIPRDYVQQPPLVPHSIEGYRINRKSNKCLSCHSWANYKESGATKISQTHFQDRDRNVRANVAGSRYFCTQCHVPQRDAQPLVENLFQPVDAIRQQ